MALAALSPSWSWGGSTDSAARFTSKKMFTIDNNFIAAITAMIGSVFTDFLPLLVLFVGLIIGAFIIEEIIYVAFFKNKEEAKK